MILVISGALVMISLIAPAYVCILLTVVHYTRDAIAVVTKYIWVMKH